MSLPTTQVEARSANLLKEREALQLRAEVLMEAVNQRQGEDTALTDAENEIIVNIRDRVTQIDAELEVNEKDIVNAREARERANKLHKMFASGNGVLEEEGDDIEYRSFAAYARDEILSRSSSECAKIGAQLGNDEVLKARERIAMLKARVNNTLSSNVGGLTPPQHIDQIFQIIQMARPIVASATKADLQRGTLTYPKVVTRPVVAVQESEKTAAGDTGMEVDMVTTTASVYLGGGDLSWQAINWSTPSALDLWFQLAASDYALKTEQDAAKVITLNAESHGITTRFGATGTFADFMTAAGAGAAKVYADSGRMADTVYMAPDRYWYAFGTTSAAFAQFASIGNDSVGPLQFVASRGLDSGTIIVGDSSGLLVAETPGAPVELRVVEPAIGGLEVGIIGGFEAVVVDEGAFALVTTAS